MYISRNITARSRNLCCYGEVEMRSLFIVGIVIAINNTKPLSVDRETQQ